VFEYHLDNGIDIGGSVAVYIDGEPVVELWGGYFDATYTRSWKRDTIVQTFSTTKTMTALVALMLADNGVLDLDAPGRQVLALVRRRGQVRDPRAANPRVYLRRCRLTNRCRCTAVLANGGAYGKRLLSDA
jgi:CubicO group peptidase (beta-lactamase class C family)